FGEARGMNRGLRSALGSTPDPRKLRTVFEPHARGSILVAAVFDAFLTIYKSRIADLLRIASGGSGVLAAGALHPDLVNRLAGEAARAAGHILQMCVRALDYCPPVDITFGEYLRAMITADRDLVPEDDRSYRLAVVEAFRRRGIYPRDVRSLSVETLLWQEPLPESLQQEFGKLFRGLEKLRCMQPKLVHSSDREALYKAMMADAVTVHDWLKAARLEKVEAAMGITLDPQAPQSLRRKPGESAPVFEVHSVRPARRVGPDGHTRTDLVIEVTQRRRAFYDEKAQARAEKRASDAEPDFWFRGGSTLLVDPESGRVRYCIAKNILSERRLARQRAFLGGSTPSLRATYFEFGEARKTRDAEPFALLHRGWEEEVVR
ncbi:MAG: S8 family serine peptidase, partial [Thermoanaerobaculia bacterium]